MDQFYPPKRSGAKLVVSFLLVASLSFGAGWQLTEQGVLGGAEEEDVVVQLPEVDFGNDLESEVDLGLFWKVWEEIGEKYINVEKLDQEVMVYGAIEGFVNSLNDPYTVFMTPTDTEEFLISLDGQLEGIGAELTVTDGLLTVVTPLKGSPAERAGILPNDVIYKIEGEDARDMTLMDAITIIRGEKGTTVNLTIVRESEDEAFDVSIVRDAIEVDSISVENLDSGVVYIAVNQFNDKTEEQFSEAISDMILDEPEGLIIDLRFNGGGYLDISVEMLSHLLPNDEKAVIIRERNKEDEVQRTVSHSKLLNVPLVVLVNEGSASASEIVAGAIQDHERGVVMGTTSFGKGSVQEVEYFNDGSSLRLTIAKWLTPEERDIDEVGITPDIVLEISDEDIENQFDSQKQAAIDYLLEL